MSNDILTAEELEQITGKKRYSGQAAWFKAQFDVDVPRRGDGSIVMTKDSFEKMLQRRLGVATAAAAPLDLSRPPIYQVSGRRK
ncbi:DUF4224 domain-containing protein [Burkholderia contaminans]|uniref:DUF4224 domain-containing protein n=1 Tax=Burkholderia contaminans TaxID=488447 RepID=A0A6P2YV28_9BURK|nr:DUF4224 domain-containing protein [Burkholderia contaminans]VWD26113.1 hypothetical protein BCO71033_03529 [Burkholderia contaminans]